MLYFHEVHYYFDDNLNLLDETEIEGPFPICDNVFEENKRCDFG